MEPPPCIQNAMLTKDKKPFTYTPGGLNLSEIRSPRMARRIERNAAYEGVQTPPQQPTRPQIPTSSLPPSTLAAMQPQMHVQVFPSGPPPAPPMMKNNGVPVPPPPPPPAQSKSSAPPPPPLPTQKVRTSDQQIVERPDMTKIIPENPMAMLKKTGGPKIKNTLLDEVYREPQPPPRAPHVNSPVPAQHQNFQPSWQNQENSQTTPGTPNSRHWDRRNSPPTWPQQNIKPPSPPTQATNNARNWIQPDKNVNVGSIYIPPLNQQNPSIQSPKTPGTPTLKEAPKPWQQKQYQKQEEAPEWVRKQPVKNEETSPVPTQQNLPEWTRKDQNPSSPPDFRKESTYAQSPTKQPEWVKRGMNSPQTHSQSPSRWPQKSPQFEEDQKYTEDPPFVRHQRYEVPQPPNPAEHPNAVFVTQPIILQHPGSGYGPPIITRRENNAQQPVKREGVGEIIIPIRVEGNTPEPPSRSIPRQQPTWGGDSYEKEPQGMMNRLNRQVPQEGNGGPNRGPQIRNIPIQIESTGGGGGGCNSPQTYIPPSQQLPAEEPRKYMGGSIPSRSFRMLQAMTAPDSCANANVNKDANWTYPPCYPMYPPPPYYYPSPSMDRSDSDPDLTNKKPRNFYPPPSPYFYPSTDRSDSDPELVKSRKTPTSRCSSVSELENINNNRTTPVPPYFYTDSGRNTPVPYWYFPPDGAGNFYPPYPPYYDPYFFSYYYNYPPIYSPLPYANFNTDTDEANGYSSMDEMTYYTEKSKEPPSKIEEIPVPPQIEIKITPPPPMTEEENSDSETDTVNENQESEDEETDSRSSSPSPSEYDDDENIPHQLSVIFEVSERTETTSRGNRGSSVASDSTLKSEDEGEEKIDEEESKSQWSSGNLMEIASRINNVINARIEGDNLGVTDKQPYCQFDLKEIKNCQKFSEETEEKKELDVETKEENYTEYVFKVPFKKKQQKLEESIEKKVNEEISEEHRDVSNRNIISCASDFEEESSEVEHSETKEDNNPRLPVEEKICDSADKEETDSQKNAESSSESEDFWKILGKDEDDVLPRAKKSQNEEIENSEELPRIPTPSSETSDETSSESSESDSEDEVFLEATGTDENKEEEKQEDSEEVLQIPSIKDRIRALQESIAAKKKALSCNAPVKEELQQNKINSAKSSLKSFDEISEEDSGVTDMSKEEEEFPELKKMSRYQRASTHSRLFELLQEECGEEEENEEIENDDTQSQLSLHLSSSNDKLVDELVRSLLKQKKCAVFRQLSTSKLYAAARKILQTTENESSEVTTPSEGFSEFVSPQDFYFNEYAAYYDTWAKAAVENLSNVKCPRIVVNSDLNQNNPRLPKS